MGDPPLQMTFLGAGHLLTRLEDLQPVWAEQPRRVGMDSFMGKPSIVVI